MTQEEIESICYRISEISGIPSVGWKMGIPHEYIKHTFKITNSEIEENSHYSHVINSFQEAVNILVCLEETKTEEELTLYLKSNSEYEEGRPMYFHYIKFI